MCEALTCVCCTSMSREIPTLHEIYTKVGLLGKKGDFRCFSKWSFYSKRGVKPLKNWPRGSKLSSNLLKTYLVV